MSRFLALLVLAIPFDTGNRPLWFDVDGRPNAAAHALIASLLTIDSRGLDPTDYAAARWREVAATLDLGPRKSDSVLAEFDAGLSAVFEAALCDLHAGRVDPGDLGYRLHGKRQDCDLTTLARDALATGHIADAFAQAEPHLAQYRHLESALAFYRGLDQDSTVGPVFLPRHTIHPGDSMPSAEVLRRWLIALGDLPLVAPTTDRIYDEVLVRGVRTFQRRRGLDSSGVIGPETIAALREPASWYVRRLALALERLRWVPDRDTAQVIVVDIPAFRLWALDSIQSDAPPTLAMNAIVGQALKKQTPVLDETMRAVVFRPYWDVPSAIARREIVPTLRRNPHYLDENDMELVPNVPLAKAIVGLASGAVRVRQRPGPANALGLVKFVFPNDLDIYMHGTPAAELFQRTRRDFSHGCIRVQDPARLAEYVLRGNAGWTRDRIDSAMHGDQPLEVELARPIPVLIFYATTVVWPDGTVAFYPDVYGHDARLDRALHGRTHV